MRALNSLAGHAKAGFFGPAGLMSSPCMCMPVCPSVCLSQTVCAASACNVCRLRKPVPEVRWRCSAGLQLVVCTMQFRATEPARALPRHLCFPAAHRFALPCLPLIIVVLPNYSSTVLVALILLLVRQHTELMLPSPVAISGPRSPTLGTRAVSGLIHERLHARIRGGASVLLKKQSP